MSARGCETVSHHGDQRELDGPAVAVVGLRHRYPSPSRRRRGRPEDSPRPETREWALDGLDLEVQRGEVFAVLGPNGCGKSTLFRVLSTLVPPQQGRVALLGCELPRDTRQVRSQLGVVFQSPGLDKKLTVAENILVQASLYGIPLVEARRRMRELLERLDLTGRADERTETLSGGLRRRAELAKGLLHRPRLVLLDEPSTGLDPGARRDLWRCLQELRSEGATVLLTTHLLDEAERSDRLAIIDQGRLVVAGRPDALRAEVGGETLTLNGPTPSQLAGSISERHRVAARVVDGAVRLELPRAHEWVSRLMSDFGDQIESLTVGRPTLEDVFIQRTGHRLYGAVEEPTSHSGDQLSVGARGR